MSPLYQSLWPLGEKLTGSRVEQARVAGSDCDVICHHMTVTQALMAQAPMPMAQRQWTGTGTGRTEVPEAGMIS